MKVRLMPFTSFWLIAAIGLAACAASIQSPVTLEAASTKGDAQITLSVTGNMAIIDIVSPNGIGSVVIEKTGGYWPPKVVMRFHLKGLEDLRLTYDDKIVKVSVSSRDDNAVRESVMIGGIETPITSDSPYWMNVKIVAKDGSPGTIPLKEGYIQVEAPRDFMPGGYTKFSMEWIDFYR